jgi:hypothetical protein
MIQAIAVWLLTLFVAVVVISFVCSNHKELDRRFLFILFFYHTALAFAYYIYAILNPSDSHQYYQSVLNKYGGDTWLAYTGSGTDFIEFLAYPLVNGLGLSYESCMVLFAFFGFLGFVYFYIFFKERIQYNPKIFGFDGTTIIFLLPNLHFWSSSLGKGSVIFLGFGLFFYSLKNPIGRVAAFIVGGWLIYQIRSHIFFVVLIAIALGFSFSTKGVGLAVRLGILAIASVLLIYIYDDILRITGFEDQSVFDPLVSHRASELAKATSGIDITNYSQLEKIFAFCFRPLFFDAPGMLGFIVSFENLVYLILFIRILFPTHLKNLITGDAIMKTCFLTFAGVSIALAQISGNLGLAMRQKSQVMILMMFVILKLLDIDQIETVRSNIAKKLRMEKLKKRLALARS